MKKAILVVSFGTTYIETRQKTIEALENMVREKYGNEYSVQRVFTSNLVRKRIKENEGLDIHDMKQALEAMKNEGIEEVYISSLHIIAGHEYHKIIEGMRQYKDHFRVIRLARPLLYSTEDYREVAAAMAKVESLQEGEALFCMGHGSDHGANAGYIMLRHFLEKEDRTKDMYIGTVEGYPELEDLFEEMGSASYKKIKLLPFMVVAGDHATNDMASDEEDSWKSLIEAKGYQTECILKGLGEFSEFREIFLRRLEAIL